MVERIGFIFTLLALVTITFNGVRVHSNATLSDLFFAIAGIIALGILLNRPRRFNGFPMRFFGAAALIAIAGTISSILSIDPKGSLFKLVALLISLLFMPLVIYIYATSMRHVWLLINAWIIGATLNAIIALGDFFRGSVIALMLVEREFYGRATGLTVHPNHFGIICAMAMPVALATSSLKYRSKNSRILYSIATVLLIIGVLISGSRAALGAAAVAVAITALANRAIRRHILILIVCAGLLGSFASIFINSDQQLEKNLFVSVTRSIGTENSKMAANERLQLYNEAVDIFAEDPLFGIGLTELTRWHNIYLQILVSFGIFGLPGFLLLLLSFLLLPLSLYKKVRTTWQINSTIIVALTASTVVWGTAGIAGNMIYDRYLYIPISILLTVRGVLWLNRRSQAPSWKAELLDLGDKSPSPLNKKAHHPLA